jgi:hypothetical protein
MNVPLSHTITTSADSFHMNFLSVAVWPAIKRIVIGLLPVSCSLETLWLNFYHLVAGISI